MRSLLALTCIPGVGSIRARHLIEVFGSAQSVLEAPHEALLRAGSVGQRVIEGRNNHSLYDRADRELEFIQTHHIHTMVYGQEGYPKRLLDCPDAPTHLFQLGNTPLDKQHFVGIVGTRQCSQYGRDIVHRFVADLREAVPDVTIVSGLALGIDVESHRASLETDTQTIGVVAHGLDRIYPYQHRDTARQMVQKGGSIITEYLTGTQPERGNFLARNRIIAGLCDAIIVAESKEKGGSLVTASIALDYQRDVFAFPGRISDDRSNGCNRLIRLNRAGLITSAQDFIESMGWSNQSSLRNPIQHSIPFQEDNLSPNARLIMDALRDRGDMRISQLSEATGIDHVVLLEELLDLEMDDKIRATPGGLYQIK